MDGFLGSRPVFLSVIAAISPYIESDSVIPPRLIGFSSDPSLSIATTEPAPPPFGISNELPFQKQATSLAFNPLGFSRGKFMATAIPDGASNTMLITEHYEICGEAIFHWKHLKNECLEPPEMKRVLCPSGSGQRRATFADFEMFKDVYPVTASGVTRGSDPVTFQIQPSLSQCDPREFRNLHCLAESFVVLPTAVFDSLDKALKSPFFGDPLLLTAENQLPLTRAQSHFDVIKYNTRQL